MSGFANFMRTALHQEPIIIWSCMISTVGKICSVKHGLPYWACSSNADIHVCMCVVCRHRIATHSPTDQGGYVQVNTKITTSCEAGY